MKYNVSIESLSIKIGGGIRRLFKNILGVNYCIVLVFTETLMISWFI